MTNPHALIIDSIFTRWISEGPRPLPVNTLGCRAGLVEYHDKMTGLYKKSGAELALILRDYMIRQPELETLTAADWTAAINDMRAAA